MAKKVSPALDAARRFAESDLEIDPHISAPVANLRKAIVARENSEMGRKKWGRSGGNNRAPCGSPDRFYPCI